MQFKIKKRWGGKRLKLKPEKSRRPRTAYEQILFYFIKPLGNLCPPTIEWDHWIEFLFGTKHRSITQYLCHKQLDKIPGLYKPLPLVYIAGYISGSRCIRIGTQIFVRHDTRLPNVFEIEAPIGEGGSSKIFQLTSDEWFWVKRDFFDECSKDSTSRQLLGDKVLETDPSPGSSPPETTDL